MREPVTRERIVAALPSNGDIVTEAELLDSLGFSEPMRPRGRSFVQYAMWEAAGFIVRRNPRGRVVGYQRWLGRSPD